MITIKPINYKWNPSRNLNLTDRKDILSFNEFISSKFIQRINYHITEGKFSHTTAPPHYKSIEYIYNDLSINPWTFMLDTIHLLEYRAITQTIRYKVKKIHSFTVQELVRALEYGSTMNSLQPRPLFRTTLNELESEIPQIYEEWKYVTGKL